MVATLELAQSTPLCIGFSALGGAIEVLATALLAWKDANERETGNAWSRKASIGALVANVTLQVTSSILGNLIATWFGPVSLVGPVFLGAQLVANMIVFGYLLGLESFNKDMKVGTFVVVIGVVLLPIVGPAAQENQDVAALLEQLHSLIWSAILVAGMLVSAILLLVLNVPKLSETWRIAILLVARSTAFSVNLTVSKVMVLDISTVVLMTSIGLKVASGLVITYALIVQASAVAQNKFTPLNASALILVNAVTGMIVWEDYKVVRDWVGYTCVFVQLILGNYLLMGDIPMLSPENQKYGRAGQLQMVAGSMTGCVVAIPNDEQTFESELTAVEEGPSGFEYFEGGHGTRFETNTPGPPRRRRRPSTREAWSSVYGINPDDASFARGVHRRRTIFTIDEESVGDGIQRRGSF